MSEYSTGLELILNAAEGALQIAVTENEKTLCFEEWHNSRRGTEILVPALREICQRLDIDIKNFRRIACVSGPGSFTGIRLTLVTASALMRASHAQLASLDYLQALATCAAMRRGLLYPQRIIAITSARRNLVHYQEFISYGPQIPAQPRAGVELISPQGALERMADYSCHVCGSGIIRNPGCFALTETGRGPEAAPNAILMPELVYPDCASLCLLARHGDYFPKDIEPKYVRPCDAVQQLDMIAEKQGMDKNEAADALRRLLNKEPGSES